jgi:hypothetical protein
VRKILAASNSPVKPNAAKAPSGLKSLFWTPLIAIGAAAFAVEIPFFFFGTPSGHDVEFHLYSWLEVLAQWKQGILFARWAAMAQFGYGEPRFIFYPPASRMLGAVVSTIFPWSIASAVYIWIALTLAGISMFFLVQRWFDRRDALFAAVLYAVNPYHLVIVYWRSAFAELLAACLLPLLLLLVLRTVEEKEENEEEGKNRRPVLPLAVVMAAAWLTNAPAAVMIHYSLAFLLLVFFWQRPFLQESASRQKRSLLPKSSRRLLHVGAMAILLGAGLAAFYLLPAIYEQKWVNIAEAVSAGSRPQDNFLFVHTSDADHDAFNRIISWVAILEIVVACSAAWASRRWFATRKPAWNALSLWAGGCSILMFPLTLPLWKYLPKLEFMQFPWRWLLCLSMIFSIFVTAGVRRWWMRGAICAVVVLVIATAWHRILPPWWDNASDLREMRDNMTDDIGYEGVDEYTPMGADPSAVDKEARKVRVDGTAHAAIHVFQWNAESKFFTAEMSAPAQLALRLFCYPAWKVEVNDRAVEPAEKPGTGQMLVPVEAGVNRVQIRFVRTWDRTAGEWISIATAILVVLWPRLGIRARRIKLL